MTALRRDSTSTDYASTVLCSAELSSRCSSAEFTSRAFFISDEAEAEAEPVRRLLVEVEDAVDSAGPMTAATTVRRSPATDSELSPTYTSLPSQYNKKSKDEYKYENDDVEHEHHRDNQK